MQDENAHFFLKIDDSNVPFTLSVTEIFESSTVDVRISSLEDLDYESDKKSYSFKVTPFHFTIPLNIMIELYYFS